MNYITEVLEKLDQNRENINMDMPSRRITKQFIEESINILFPIKNRLSQCRTEQEAILYRLEYLLKRLLLPVSSELNISVDKIVYKYITKLPSIYKKLLKDAEAIRNFDPAATNIGEVVIAYPGFYAIAVYRLSNILYKLNIPIIPRLMSEQAHGKTGIDINPGANIGESFFIDHGTGIVIGETAHIKNNVKIYQGVTLGAIQVKKEFAKKKRHPTVEDNVTIYSNATILGGETIIGKNSIIGGNVWLTSSVNNDSIVYHSNKIKIRTNINENSIIDFQI